MDREVDQALEKIGRERAELEKELQALSNELKAAYSRASMGVRRAAEGQNGLVLGGAGSTVDNGDAAR